MSDYTVEIISYADLSETEKENASNNGWGQRVDEIKEFLDLESANLFIDDYNKENNLDYVPDWYMYATL